jgi:hypothetical protein
MARDKKISLIISAKNQAKGAFASIKKGLGGIGAMAKKLFSPTGLILGGIAGFGLGKLAGSFIDTASSFEGLEASLITTTGSLAKAREAIAFANKEAAASPYTVLEYGEAIRTLSAYGVDYTKVMKTVGDTSAAMNKPLSQAVEALADALQGEGERLKEFGIKQKIAGDQITYTWVDAMGQVRESVAKNSPEIIQQTLLAIWNEKYKGGMDQFASTWKGLTSTATSLWDEFKLAIMNSGAFELLKKSLQVIIEKINEAKAAGDFQKWADTAGQAIFDVGKAIITVLPKALLVVLEIISKISMGIRGWQMLISEVKIAWYAVARFMQDGLLNFGKVMAVLLDKMNINGMFDDQIRGLVDFVGSQRQVMNQLDKDRDTEILKQQQVIDGYTKEQQEIEGYKKKVEEMQGAFDNFVSSVTEVVEEQKKMGPAAKEGVGQATDEVEKYIIALKRAKAAQQELSDFRGSNFGGNISDLERNLSDAERTE